MDYVFAEGGTQRTVVCQEDGTWSDAIGDCQCMCVCVYVCMCVESECMCYNCPNEKKIGRCYSIKNSKTNVYHFLTLNVSIAIVRYANSYP